MLIIGDGLSLDNVNRLIDLHIALDAITNYGHERAMGENLTHTLQEVDGKRRYAPNDPLVEFMRESMKVSKYDTLPNAKISDVVERVLTRIGSDEDLSLVTKVAAANIFDKDYERVVQYDFEDISKKGLSAFQMEVIGLARIDKSLNELEQEFVKGTQREIELANRLGISPSKVQSQIGQVSPFKTKSTQIE